MNGKRAKEMRREAKKLHMEALLGGKIDVPQTGEEALSQLRSMKQILKRFYKRARKQGIDGSKR